MSYTTKMKQSFDNLTDIVEKAQSKPKETGSVSSTDRKVIDSQGETITLNDNKHPKVF